MVLTLMSTEVVPRTACKLQLVTPFLLIPLCDGHLLTGADPVFTFIPMLESEIHP